MRLSGRLLAGSLGALWLVTLGGVALQGLRLRDHRRQVDAWGELKRRLEREAEEAREQSLFFSSRLMELETELVRRERRGGSAPDAAYRCETWHRSIDARVSQLAADTAEIAAKLGKSEEAAAEVVVARLRELIETRLGGIESAAQKSAGEVSALEQRLSEQAAAATTAREQAEARMAELLAKVEERRAAASPDEIASIRALLEKGLAGAASALRETREEVASLRAAVERQSEESLAARERLAGEIDRVEAELASAKPAAASDAAASAEPHGHGGNGAPEPEMVPVEVAVEAVDDKRGLVVIGAGAKDGLSPDQVLEVWRDGKRVGRIRLLRVLDDMSGAKVIAVAPGESLRSGDLAMLLASAPREAPESPPEGAPGRTGAADDESVKLPSVTSEVPPPPAAPAPSPKGD